MPRAIFCSSAACARNVGFVGQGAYNVGTVGFIVSPRGWHAHFVRHELIHHLQNERLDSLHAWLLKPDWLREGMAYSLSDDPRHPLPPPLQAWRAQFDQWRAAVGPDRMWQAAEQVNQRPAASPASSAG